MKKFARETMFMFRYRFMETAAKVMCPLTLILLVVVFNVLVVYFLRSVDFVVTLAVVHLQTLLQDVQWGVVLQVQL